MLFKKIAGLSCEFLIDNLKPLIEVSGGRAFFAVGRQHPFIKCLQRHLINAADGQGAAVVVLHELLNSQLRFVFVAKECCEQSLMIKEESVFVLASC